MANKVEEALYRICTYSHAYGCGLNSEQFFQVLTGAVNTSDLCYEGQPNFPVSRPDILLFDDEFVYGIEHFEFDDSEWTKKGSPSRAFMSKKEKDFDANFEKNSVPSKVYYESFDMAEESSFDNGYDHFVNNFKYGFDEHYKKINDYKTNIENLLKAKNMKRKIKIYFLIENSSLIIPLCGGMPDVKDNGVPYIPFYSKEILEKINSAVDLDGIISLNKKTLFVYSRDDGLIDIDSFFVDKRHYYTSKPCVMKAKAII